MEKVQSATKDSKAESRALEDARRAISDCDDDVQADTLVRIVEMMRAGEAIEDVGALARTIAKGKRVDLVRANVRRRIRETTWDPCAARWASLSTYQAAVREEAQREAYARQWPGIWWATLRADETWTADVGEQVKRARKTAKQRIARKPGDVNARFAAHEAGLGRVFRVEERPGRLNVDGRRKRIVLAMCSPWRTDEPAPTARDLALAALSIGDWPELEEWQIRTVAYAIKLMTSTMRKVHAAVDVARPLAKKND